MTAVALALEAPAWFELPESLIATRPAEARGLARDEVKLLVSHAQTDCFTHTRFTHFADYLREGDVVVVNSSATLNAALNAARPNGEQIELHLSQRLFDDRWVVELRRFNEKGTEPLRSASIGEIITLPEGGAVTLIRPYSDNTPRRSVRLWIASVKLPRSFESYLDKYGSPITYSYTNQRWPLPYYQTLFARTPGSAEMPSAARPFTPRVVESLGQRGVTIASILLHTGVSSLEDHEPPYPEYYRIDSSAARVINDTRDRGGRVIAVGTTVVRALETAVNDAGRIIPGGGWTGLVITPERELRAVDGMVTGFHEPRASHLAMLEALAGKQHIRAAYDEAIRHEYLWHEFGDSHLICSVKRVIPSEIPSSTMQCKKERLQRGRRCLRCVL